MTPTSPPGHRPVRRSSSTSRCSTTTSAVTRRWGTYPQPSTNGKTLNPLSTFRGELQDALVVRDRILPDWLAKRGLSLSEEKTRIVHLTEGFDFLSFNIRRFL